MHLHLDELSSRSGKPSKSDKPESDKPSESDEYVSFGDDMEGERGGGVGDEFGLGDECDVKRRGEQRVFIHVPLA